MESVEQRLYPSRQLAELKYIMETAMKLREHPPEAEDYEALGMTRGHASWLAAAVRAQWN